VKYVDARGLTVFLKGLAQDYDVYAPRKVGEELVLARVEPEQAQLGQGQRGQDQPGWAWNEHRLAESYKPFFFQTGKVVSRWTPDGPQSGAPPRPRALLGVKACDLKALQVIDKVFRDHEFKEPAWCAARDANLVIAGDCTGCADSCFCTLLGDNPWADGGYDLSLAPTNGGYLVAVGSEKGEAQLAAQATLFREAPAGAVEAREEARSELKARLESLNAKHRTHDPLATSVAKNLKTRIWGKLAATCVQCNACNLVCPTCHCFLLHDVKTPDGSARLSMWDSCFHSGYARMAGGGTPRLQLTERFKNHYFHKFVSFPENWGITACSGCGRCIDACMGRIDKRECLYRLETEWLPSEVLEEIS